ncbi:carboxymuconolactone decarboxylase family protein [Lentibacter algarum]|uniref:carboxymuconolactone decarboxylase family protein n=1 Tax=Lentibacter algarum TaxID=576131 RepID=UPI001C07820C|nr:carboxymuconolactone decarboxylase family protein [Lentibacter algarum]MBU2982084.1 carboxymuconolactone decarboxylase family protein [Lentibacter algarum]
MSQKTAFEQMMAQAQEMAKSFAPALETFTPKGFEAMMPTMPKEMMEAVFGKGLGSNGLDAKTKLLLMLAGQTMQGAQAEAQLRLTVRHLIEAGATEEEIAESIGLMSMFAGIPAMTRAMDIAKGVMADTKDDET